MILPVLLTHFEVWDILFRVILVKCGVHFVSCLLIVISLIMSGWEVYFMRKVVLFLVFFYGVEGSWLQVIVRDCLWFKHDLIFFLISRDFLFLISRDWVETMLCNDWLNFFNHVNNWFLVCWLFMFNNRECCIFHWLIRSLLFNHLFYNMVLLFLFCLIVGNYLFFNDCHHHRVFKNQFLLLYRHNLSRNRKWDGHILDNYL